MTLPGKSVLNTPELLKLKVYLINAISREMESRQLAYDEQRQAAAQIMQQAYQATKLKLPPTLREQLFHDILDEMLGFGPLQPLLDDPEISEVIVNGTNRGLMGAEGQVVDQIWEKVDDPTKLTPEPGPTSSPPLTEPPAATPGETALPLESAPAGADQPAPTVTPQS